MGRWAGAMAGGWVVLVGSRLAVAGMAVSDSIEAVEAVEAAGIVLGLVDIHIAAVLETDMGKVAVEGLAGRNLAEEMDLGGSTAVAELVAVDLAGSCTLVAGTTVG
jgi:hypothetical protein